MNDCMHACVSRNASGPVGWLSKVCHGRVLAAWLHSASPEVHVKSVGLSPCYSFPLVLVPTSQGMVSRRIV